MLDWLRDWFRQRKTEPKKIEHTCDEPEANEWGMYWGGCRACCINLERAMDEQRLRLFDEYHL
jgi:hypothetical protein